MQMEPWRKRGFVPDSDEEEELDSLEAKQTIVEDRDESEDVDLEYIPFPVSASRPQSGDTVHEHSDARNENGSTTLFDVEESHVTHVEDTEGQEPATNFNAENDKSIKSATPFGMPASETKNRIGSSSLGERTPKPRRTPRTYGKRSSSTRTPSSLVKDPQDAPAIQYDSIWDIPSSPVEQVRPGRKARSHESTPNSVAAAPTSQTRVVSGTNTTRAPELDDSRTSRSSSPDEINVVMQSPARTPPGNEQSHGKNAPQQEASDDASPLSSPPSSLHSPHEDPPDHNVDVAPTEPQADPQDDHLPTLEELLGQDLQPPEQPSHPEEERHLPDEQLHTSHQRTFRKRKPQQTNPYTYEMAIYLRQCRESGTKPSRAGMEAHMRQQKTAQTTDESQEQDSYDPKANRSSPAPEEWLPPVRPERQRERDTAAPSSRHLDQQESPVRRTQSYKRRKKLHSCVWNDNVRRMHSHSRPQVVIDKTPPRDRIGLSIFEIPSSPTRSVDPPSASKTPRASMGFRYPPGFTPPPTTTTGVDSNPATPPRHEPSEVISLGSTLASDEEAGSDASHGSAESDEDVEQGQNRLMQRRIRGVLPASWVRIDAQQRLKQQKASQQNRHAAAAQRADGKGVARKIVRQREPNSRPQLGLIDLGDADESDEENQPPRPVEPEQDADQRLADIAGFENSFDRDGDILEDNRIDYMLPTISRNSGPREKRKSLKRVHSKESSEQKEGRLKKARLKRQTRLTDASYGSRRTKQPKTISAPRLGILDAPDVSSRPRKEQPQFLRVAARRARSRRDGGRQSPTRKFLKLDSKDDTVDANESLRVWRRGAIRQTRIERPQPKPRKSQSITKNSVSGRQAASVSRNTRIPHHFAAAEQVVIPDDNQPTPEHRSTGSLAVPGASTGSLNESAGAGSSRQAERRGNEWIVRRNVAISSLQRNNPRPAAASMAEPSESQAANRAMFGRSLSLLSRDFRRKQSARAFHPSLTLDRYISGSGSPGSPNGALPAAASEKLRNSARDSSRQRRGRLKKTPKRINLESDEFVQDQEPPATVSDDLAPPSTAYSASTRPSSFSMGGLFNWQRSYSIDFGVSPLRDGTFFHETTFIGSGEFSRSLHVLKRDLDQESGFSSMTVKERVLQWGAWNEMVSSGMGSTFDMIIDEVEKSASSSPETSANAALVQAALTYRSLIKYVTDTLAFIDPIDRTSFVSRAMSLVYKLRDPMAAFITGTGYNTTGLMRFACYNLVFANQIRQIASHALVSSSLQDDALAFVKTSARDALELILSEAGIAELQRFLDETKKLERREKGFREEFPSAEAFIVAQQLLRSSDAYAGLFDDLHLEIYTKSIAPKQKDISALESGWRGLFAPLPLIEVDGHGIARREARFKLACDNWVVVKKLLSPALEYYDTNAAAQPISYNVYCRALFQRCHRLINLWGWRECRPILEALYDFFAQKTLYNLKLEESRGSPSFLDELDQSPSLDVRTGEPCFHTLLKIIASGLRFLSGRYDTKKIRNFAWRLLPNHGRVYPKEQPLRHEDLDALRNHHDLLCTLYWAVPDGCRPRLETIRNLVHPASSHRETCSINIRSWTRLVRFKLSTDEDVAGLDPFADWHSYFLTELRHQHSHARKEIEAQSKDDRWVSRELIESTISQNQRQIESLLSMALGGMQTAVELAPSLGHAHRLICKTPFDSILGLFNPKLARVNVVVSDALRVIVAYTQKVTVEPPPAPGAAAPAATVSFDEDSQEFDFGDWSDIDAVLVQQNPPSEGIEHVQNVLHPIVSRLVSNCFGADQCPEDAIFVNVVNCWVSLAQVLVRRGLKHWENYISQFGEDSWTRLRDTLQTRKFAPQFLAACIEKDVHILLDCRVLVMTMWLASLVERSSMLKFQHRLTEVLLNGSPHDPLLQNLPFTKDKKTDRYAITLEEFGQRRLSLLSSLLSNMRGHVLHLEISADGSLNVTKQEYSEMLQRLMMAMKDNYRELGNGAVESAQGAYVDFVHRVIRFLQELTSDIRPVDPFFTDPALFPLPSTDPRYIVAKLKRYEPKLFSNKELVTLTGFVQGIAERALVEGQQSHLVDQLHTAMKDTYEAGRPDQPTLRSVLLQCVFPAYLELTFSNPAAWLLSRPVIQSISLVFKDLLFNLDTTDPACVSSLLETFDAVFQSTYRALRPLSNRPSRLREPIVLSMLANFVEMVSSSLPVVDYIDRLGEDAGGLVCYIQWFRDFANAVASHTSNVSVNRGSDERFIAVPTPEPTSDPSIGSMPQHLAAARRLAFEDHQVCLRNWSLHEGKYYYTRPGHDSKEIALEPAVAAIVENKLTTKKQFEDATSLLTDQIERLGLLPPYQRPRDEVAAGEESDEISLSDMYSFLRLWR